MPTYNLNDVAQLKHVNALAQLTKSKLDETVKFVSASGNTVSFFKTADGSGTAAFTVDLPEAFFLDQAGTKLVDNFTFSTATYPGATNPDLDGKTVLVLAVKGDAEATTVNYSFVDMAKLLDVSDKIDKPASAVEGNFATWGASGTLVDSGYTIAKDEEVVDMLNDVFGAGSISSI